MGIGIVDKAEYLGLRSLKFTHPIKTNLRLTFWQSIFYDGNIQIQQYFLQYKCKVAKLGSKAEKKIGGGEIDR